MVVFMLAVGFYSDFCDLYSCVILNVIYSYESLLMSKDCKKTEVQRKQMFGHWKDGYYLLTVQGYKSLWLTWQADEVVM